MGRRYVRRVAGAALLVITTVAVSACTAAVPGSPQAADPIALADLPWTEDTRQEAVQASTFRSWDMCAMHDVDAALSAAGAGYAAVSMQPYLGFGDCKLVVNRSSPFAAWELTVKIGRSMATDGRTPLTIGGRQLPQVENRETECGYALPVGDPAQGWGIEVHAQQVDPQIPPCQMASAYLTALLPKLTTPPRRTAGATRPAFVLAENDPCAGVAAIAAEALGGQLSGEDMLDVSSPYECRVSRRSADPSGRSTSLSVSFDLDTLSSYETTPAAVAGRPATVRQRESECEVQAQAGDATVQDRPGSDPQLELVSLRTPNCGMAIAHAEKVVALLRPATPPADGAQVLGDQNAPKSAAEVGAPFDPCTVVDWNTYPPEVRPRSPKKPVQASVRAEDPFSIGCKFNSGPQFSILVWGRPTGQFTADPAARPGTRPAQFGGRAGLEEPETPKPGQARCYSAIPVSNGIAAISTTIVDEAAVDPCAVNRAVLTAVAAKVP